MAVPSSAADQTVTQEHVLAVAKPAHMALLDRGNGDPLIRAVQIVPVSRSFKRIRLMIFGGAAEIEEDAMSPTTELAVAIVGPLTSAVIGVGLVAAGVDGLRTPLSMGWFS